MGQELPRELWRFFAMVAQPYSGRFVLIFMLFGAAAVAGVLVPYQLKGLIDGVGASAPEEVYARCVAEAAMLLVLAVAVYLFRLGAQQVVLHTMPNVRVNVIIGVFDYVSRHSVTFFNRQFLGSVVNKISDLATGTSNIFNMAFRSFFELAVSVVAAAVITSLVQPLFGALIVGWTALFLGVAVLLARRSRRYSRVLAESRSRAIGKVADSVGNYTNVKLFSRTSYEIDQVWSSLTRVRERDQAAQRYFQFVVAVLTALNALLLAAMMALLLHFRARGMVTPGDFALMLTLSIQVITLIRTVADQIIQLSDEVGRCQQALAVLGAPHEVFDIADAAPIRVERGNIRFCDVTFGYNAATPLFRGLSLQIPAGQKVGLVGHSGCGKSTVVNLLLRYFDVQEGAILIDGQDIAHGTQESLREQISVIPQETTLFHRRLIENIRYGRLSASFEDVVAAATDAGAIEFIRELEFGLNTVGGERGAGLSGGQRQRLAIARAVIKNAPILVLDEATSALDAKSEHFVQERLRLLMQGRTTIVIAHRLTTLAGMDRVLVFDNGRIVEDGSPAELLASNGRFAALYRQQKDGFLPRAA